MPITVSGTSITFNDATTQTTAFTGGGGTVTSVATGNGLSGGTITTSGTLVVACPGFNTVGSYVFGACISNNGSFPNNITSGGTVSAGPNNRQVSACQLYDSDAYVSPSDTNNLSGTWRWMSANMNGNLQRSIGIFCRVS
jgi:hypothetical protein